MSDLWLVQQQHARQALKQHPLPWRRPQSCAGSMHRLGTGNTAIMRASMGPHPRACPAPPPADLRPVGHSSDWPCGQGEPAQQAPVPATGHGVAGTQAAQG